MSTVKNIQQDVKGNAVKAVIAPAIAAYVTACVAFDKASATLASKAVIAVNALYGDTFPEFAPFQNDIKALGEALKGKGVKSSDKALVAFRDAVKAKFGAIPVSMAGKALKAQKARRDGERAIAYEKAWIAQADKPAHLREAIAQEAASKVARTRKQVVQATAGAPAGQAQERTNPRVDAKAAVQQCIAEFGFEEVIRQALMIANADPVSKNIAAILKTAQQAVGKIESAGKKAA